MRKTRKGKILVTSSVAQAFALEGKKRFTLRCMWVPFSTLMSIEQYFAAQFNTAPAFVARAPGRLEFIGNHLDYNGGLVLGAAIDRYVTVAVAPRADRRIVLASESQPVRVENSLDALAPAKGATSWGNYPLGMLKVMRDAGLEVSHGFNLAVSNDLPIGAGLSSSAAIELATGLALGALYHYSLDRRQLAFLGRAAENNFVGMPCGILDQGSSAFGKAGSLVLIDCATNDFSTRPMPGGTHFWVFNTLKKHTLIDSFYAARNRECMESLAILRQTAPSLANLATATEEQVKVAREDLGETRFKRALHVVREMARVRDTLAALDAQDTARVGRNLTASHGSSRELFENSCEELDFLVARVVGMPGVFGARLSGGGFGGAAMALTDGSFSADAAGQLLKDYRAKFGNVPTIFSSRTGDGAALL
ncbi:MAG: galactokinase [Puniceicoccales bacterium]|nr:galactokinase [Puniceicoccales bacterium]